jgi:hypothetical protein
VLADLRRKGFTVFRIRRLLQALKTRFHIRLYEAIEGGGPLTLFLDGDSIYARTEKGELYNLLDNAAQPLLMADENLKLKPLTVRESPARRRKGGADAPPGRRPRV